ncbi:type II toxin-antitoxin system VapB family antitoxin [Nocardiopsis sp. CNT312]|uniref:type II toxin-antitoxin system VapB family antitoxin n=1 Tax=Nocardiopsis sp. CNT312 TaxID=1137268 RepID=UPI00048B3752|nr:type II toxin-antitoxin system VapB family antitoxin [Nocardiopsis sp. CNT312]
MTKVLIDIDDEFLSRASEVLGTTTKKDTVNTALRETAERLERARALARIQELAAEGAIELDVLMDKRNYRR